MSSSSQGRKQKFRRIILLIILASVGTLILPILSILEITQKPLFLNSQDDYLSSFLPANLNYNKPPKSGDDRFAYAFLVAGCNPDNPKWRPYRGYLLNVAISTHVLHKEFNSTVDVVALIRMHADSNHTALPPEDEAILTKSGVIVKYIPKPITDNFHTAMMDKFRILELTEYERVLYLDADVLPLNNLDYMFHKSIGPDAPLQENVVVAFNNEPASGGFFMLKPDKEDYKRITQIVLDVEKGGYGFNETIGFGHEIIPPDHWQALSKNGTKWDFYGAFTDQGLLYHWVKYVKKKVTIIEGHKLYTHYTDDNQDDIIKRTPDKSNKDVFSDVKTDGSISVYMYNGMHAFHPYRDFKHFVESTKPWLKRIAKNPPPDVEKASMAKFPNQLWFHVLRKLIKEFDLDIDPEHLSFGKPPLGLFPTNEMVHNAKTDREKSDQ